jgi:hypothetical protein
MRRTNRRNPAAGPRIRSGPGRAMPWYTALPSVTDHGAGTPISFRAVTGVGAARAGLTGADSVRAVTTTVAACVAVKGAR